MDSAEFQRRIANAQTKLVKMISRFDQAARSQEVDPFDTGAGGSEHSYRIERRRKSNAMVDRQNLALTQPLYTIHNLLNHCPTPDDVWILIQNQLRMIIVSPQVGIYRPQAQGGGIDWNELNKYVNTLPASSRAAIQSQTMALKVVYDYFWK